MTTIKEYEAMMEGALPTPYYVANYAGKFEIETPIGGYTICQFISYIRNKVDDKLHAQFIAASRNIAPELIRVIELAELTIHAQLVLMKELSKEGTQFPMAEKALSEIRKLKGD